MEIEKKYLLSSSTPPELLIKMITGTDPEIKKIEQIYIDNIASYAGIIELWSNHPDILENIKQSGIKIDNKTTIRVRQVNNSKNLLTLKNGSGIVREEVEFEISPDVFSKLKPLNFKRVIKTRYKIKNPFPNMDVIELVIDKLSNAPKNLYLVEMEFNDESNIQMGEEKLFGILNNELKNSIISIRDVSHNSAYSNERIAHDGFPLPDAASNTKPKHP